MKCLPHLTNHLAGQAAAEKCLSCKHSIYRPRSGGYVAFTTEAIACSEGVFGLWTTDARRPLHSLVESQPRVYFHTIAMFKNPNSKARGKILSCQFYEQREGGRQKTVTGFTPYLMAKDIP